MVFTKDLLARVKEETDRKTVLSIYQSCLEARSYKIREAAADEIGAIATQLGGPVFMDLLSNAYIGLLKDNYADVKNTAIKQLAALAKILAREVFEQFFYPHITSLINDKTAGVLYESDVCLMHSETVAGVMVDLSAVFPELVAPELSTLMNNLIPQVRLLLLQRLDEIQLNEELVNRLVLESPMDGPLWRIREEIARHICCLLVATKDTPQQEAVNEMVSF